MRVVIALGGNALLKRGEPLEIEVQRANIRIAGEAIAAVAAQHEIILTHGNGPQVGLLSLQADAYGDKVQPYPLDVLGAESEGMIGYMLEQELMNQLPGKKLANLITQTLVDHDDPAFDCPEKFVGPVYDKQEADKLADEHGWDFKDDGKYIRRVVPSPEPIAILELEAIRHLTEGGFLVICTGGGGVPVIKKKGILRGIEAVIDKDRASCLLAEKLDFDCLLMLTDVDAVYADWGTEKAHAISEATPDEINPADFPAGSMRPKLEAACQFVRSGGRMAGIGTLADAVAILAGKAGTRIIPAS